MSTGKWHLEMARDPHRRSEVADDCWRCGDCRVLYEAGTTMWWGSRGIGPGHFMAICEKCASNSPRIPRDERPVTPKRRRWWQR